MTQRLLHLIISLHFLLALNKNKLQYKIIRKAMGYRISTQINVMLYEAKEQLLRQKFSLLMAKYLFRLDLRNPV